MWRILVVLMLGAAPLAAQSADDVRAVYSTILEKAISSTVVDVASDTLSKARVCLVPVGGQFLEPSSPGGSSVRYPRPVGASRRILKAVARDRFGDRLVSHCITRPRSGFEPALARARRSVEVSIQGPTYHYFDPYGASAVELRVSGPIFDSPAAARISARLRTNSHQSTTWTCHLLRDPERSWYAHDCRIGGEIA